MASVNGFTKALGVVAGQRRRSLVRDLSTDAPTVITGPVLLRSVYVHTAMSAHAVTFSDNSVSKFLAPASSTAGSNLLSNVAGGMKFEVDMTITPNASSTGILVITYDELN